MTVNTTAGSPTLSLNDGGTATYVSGSGTNALTFHYIVLAGQNTPDLMVTAFKLNGASIADGAGNAASLSLTGIAQGSPQVDTTAPAAPVIASNTVSGNTVTLNGTAEANSTITVFDNSTQLGTTTTNSNGAWAYTTGALANGSQSFTATATDGAGNISAASNAVPVILGAFTGNQTGTLSVTNGTALDITGTINNTGTIALDATGNGAELVLVGGTTLTGAGKVTLSNNAGNLVISNGAQATLNNANNTISGAGTIGDSELTLTNQGTVNANQTQALVVNTGSNTITNSGLFEASSTGGLYIESNVRNSKTIEALGTNAKVVIEGVVTNTSTGTHSGIGFGRSGRPRQCHDLRRSAANQRR